MLALSELRIEYNTTEELMPMESKPNTYSESTNKLNLEENYNEWLRAKVRSYPFFEQHSFQTIVVA